MHSDSLFFFFFLTPVFLFVCLGLLLLFMSFFPSFSPHDVLEWKGRKKRRQLRSKLMKPGQKRWERLLLGMFAKGILNSLPKLKRSFFLKKWKLEKRTDHKNRKNWVEEEKRKECTRIEFFFFIFWRKSWVKNGKESPEQRRNRGDQKQ